MIYDLIGIRNGHNLKVKLGEDREPVDINSTGFVVISSYTTATWNANMNQFTNTLHLLVDDK